MNAQKTLQRILVGLDSDGLAANALVRAARLAEATGARLDLVHAVEVPPPLWLGIDDAELASIHATTLVKARQQVLKSLKAVSEAAGIQVDLDDALIVRPGNPGKVLLHTAEETQADLIVIGPHAQRPFFDFGSTTRAILSRTTAPVWSEFETVYRKLGIEFEEVRGESDYEEAMLPIVFRQRNRRAHQAGVPGGTS